MPVTRRRSMAAPRRKRVWARETDTGAIGAGGITQFNLLSAFYAQLGASVPGITIGRIRLSLAFETTSAVATLDNLIVGVRVGSVTDDAVDQNPADFLAGGAHLDWMYWSKLYTALRPTQTAAAITGDAAWEIDIKAQRRLEEIGMTLWLVTSATNAAGLAGNVSYGVSTLVVLP